MHVLHHVVVVALHALKLFSCSPLRVGGYSLHWSYELERVCVFVTCGCVTRLSGGSVPGSHRCVHGRTGGGRQQCRLHREACQQPCSGVHQVSVETRAHDRGPHRCVYTHAHAASVSALASLFFSSGWCFGGPLPASRCTTAASWKWGSRGRAKSQPAPMSFLFLTLRSHSMSFTGAQGVPK